MTQLNPSRGNNPAMTKVKAPPKGVLTDLEYAELHDALTLALDALGDGPEDVSWDFLMNCVMHQRFGLKITHGRIDRIKKEGGL
jgi:hypothetical protein